MVDIKDIKKGDQILIRKGTAIRTTGKERNKVAGKDYFVTVHHTLSGMRITANTALNDRHFCYELEKYGIDEAALRKLREEDPKAFFRDCNIEITPPSVVWAGTGGYWHEASVRDIEVIAKSVTA